MLHLSILILQSTIQYTTAVTPHVTFYWKTTEDMDKVPDYWNHGPINIPGLEDIFTQTTKPPDVFPPWLTKSTKSAVTTLSTITKHSSPNSHEHDENINSNLVHLLKTQAQPKTDINITDINSIWQAILRWRMNLMSKSTQHGTTKLVMSKPTQHGTTKLVMSKPTQHETTKSMLSKEYEDIQATEPFSVFLRKIVESLTTKSLPEVPALIKPVVDYMEKLLKDNEWMGDMVPLVPYIGKVVKNIRAFLSSASPGMLHTKCYELSAMLSNQSALETDYTNLLTALDDMYTEAEEEHMQRILRNVIEFPNTDVPAQAIAHDFVDNLILFPMKRVLGTSKGDDVLLMVKSVIEKKGLRRNWNPKWNNRAITSYKDNDETNSENDVQHSISKFRAHKTHTKEKTVNASKGYTEGIYQTVRNNIHHIKSLMKNIEISSSETNEYELSSLESKEIIKKSTDNINTPSLPNTQSFRSGQIKALRKGFSLERLYGEYKEDSPSSEILQYEFSSSLESKERVKEAADNINTIHFRRKKVEMLQNGSHEESYKNNKKILRHKKYKVNSDNLNSLFNKYDVMPRVPNDNYRSDPIEMYKNTKPTIIVPVGPLGTKIIKDSGRMYENSPQHIISSGNTFIKEDSNKAITRSIRELRYNVFFKKPPKITHSSRHPFTIIYLTNKNTTLKRKPNAAIFSKYMIQMNSNQSSNKGTTHSFIYNKIKTSSIQHGYMNKIKHNVIGEYLNIAHQKELENSTLNTEYSSEDTGDRLQNKHASRIEKTLSSPPERLQGRSKNKKYYRKRSRSNRHRNKHEKRKDNEHDHTHSHNEKRKYEKLKRKYQKLKQVIGRNIINSDSNMMFDKNKKLEKDIKIDFHKSFPSLFGGLGATNINVRNKHHAKENTSLFTAKTQRPEVNLWLRRQRQEKYAVQNYVSTTKVMKYLKEKKINMRLDDYDYDSKLETLQSKTNNRPYYTKTSKAHMLNGERVSRKSFPKNATTGKFKSSEDTDEEKELKKNIYDAFRHMDFNVSWSYHNDTTTKAYLQESQETDVEAVLKSNIYKAVKNLLNK